MDAIGEGVLAPRTRKSSAYSPTKASLAKYSPSTLKRNHHAINPTHSPAKRTKNSGISDNAYSQSLRKSHYLKEDMNYNPVHHIVPSPKLASNIRRNNFLAERGKLNSLRDHNERNHRPSLKGALINVETEKLPFPDQFKGQNRYTAGGRGVRLSRTPPPFIVEPDELGEPILPPTPERPRDRSPRTKRRDFEAIFSSGSRKRKKSTELNVQNISPIRSLAARENGGVPGIAKSNYYASSFRRKNKANTLLEHRDALQREIKKLEEELVVEKRRIVASKHLQVVSVNRARFENEFPISLARWLSVNDQMVASKTEMPTIPQNGVAAPLSVLPLKNSHSSQNTKNLCPLTFTNYGPELSASLIPYSMNQHRRIVQGYSHESLLHFRLSMDILGMSIPQIQAVSVDCSDWARVELGPSLYLFSNECNINKTLYAISSFSNMARHRASVWASLHKDFSDWVIPCGSVYGPKFTAPCVELDALSVENRRRLVTNLSRRMITFRQNDASSYQSISNLAEVSLGWHINIDSSGEAYSDIFATVKLLSHMAITDEASVTKQVSNLLNALIVEYGIMEGISRLLEALFKPFS